MAENLNRKACDRCHGQKLSCKRTNDDGPCERCIRLRAVCKSSPSLRYKKQLQQQQQDYTQPMPSGQDDQHEQPPQLQHYLQQGSSQQFHAPAAPVHHSQYSDQQTHLGGAEEALAESRSPKRRRTTGQVQFVQPETAGLPILLPSRTVPNEQMIPDGTDAPLDLSGFGFNVSSVEFLGLAENNQNPVSGTQQHLLPPHLPTGTDGSFSALHSYADTWAQHPHTLLPQVPVPPLGSSPDFQAITSQAIPSSGIVEPLHTFVAPLDRRRRPGVTHPIRNRSRSTHITLDLEHILQSLFGDSALTIFDLMSQLSDIDASLRVLSVGLLARERGQESAATPNGTTSEFTVAEMYRQTHCFVNFVEQASVQQASTSGVGLDSSDPANSMFTLSTYVRLLDMFQRLFNLVKRQLSQADPNKDDTFARWQLPEMNIGAASINAHPAFHMSLTVQLAMQLLVRLRNGTANMAVAHKTGDKASNGATNGGGDSSSFAEVVHISFNAIRGKEEALNKSLATLKAELDTFMDTMDAIDASIDAGKEK